MKYKNYHAIIEYDDVAELFHGRIIDIIDVITFEGKSISELKKEMKLSIDDYVNYCNELKRKPNKPYSGKFNLRIKSKLHRKVAIKAAHEKKSINDVVSEVLEKELSSIK